MAISQLNLEEIMNDNRISPAARNLLFAIFEHDANGGPLDDRWSDLPALLKELRSANYAMRGDSWKSQAGGHYLFFDRWQEPTAAPKLPPLPPEKYGRSVLYVIGQPGTAIVKIGRTTNVGSRLRSIQTGSPVPLAVLWWHVGGDELEKPLHRKFKEYRLHGEWFDFGVEEPDILVEMAVQDRRPEEFPPLVGITESVGDYLAAYPPSARYDYLLNLRPGEPVRFPLRAVA